MLKILGLLVVAAGLSFAQTNVSVQMVTVAPTGSCNNQALMQQVVGAGLYQCVGGTWTAIGGGGSGTINVSCVEQYQTPGMNGDYGKIWQAAVNAQPLTVPSAFQACVTGNHPVGTPVKVDRPVTIYGYGSTYQPTSALASTPVNLTGCTLTEGLSTISGCSTASLAVNMRVGGIGIPNGSYIQSITDNTHFVMAPHVANLYSYGITSTTSTTVTAVSSLKGWNGQTLNTSSGTSTGTTATPNYSNNTLTLSADPVIQSTPNLITLTAATGQTWTSNIRAVAWQPMFHYVRNSNALITTEGQNFGAAIHGLSISDPNDRALQGIVGIQVTGWDKVDLNDIKIYQLAGANIIVGGQYTPTDTLLAGLAREFHINTANLDMGGDSFTGQGTIEIITGPMNQTNAADEDNEISMNGVHVTYNYGPGLLMDTYNQTHQGYSAFINGPREISFEGGQIEGAGQVQGLIQSPVDLVDIELAHDIFFSDTRMINPGYGHSLIETQLANQVMVTNGKMYDQGKGPVAFTVSVTNGSPTVTGTNFDNSGNWDGQGIQINGVNYLFAMQGACSSTTSCTLANNYAGNSGSSTTMNVGAAGYFYAVGPINGLSRLVSSGIYGEPGTFGQQVLGFSNTIVPYAVGSGFGASGTQVAGIVDFPTNTGEFGMASFGLGTSASPAYLGYECSAQNCRGMDGYGATSGAYVHQSGSARTHLWETGSLFDAGTVLGALSSGGIWGIGSSTTPTSDPFYVNAGTSHQTCVSQLATDGTTVMYQQVTNVGVVTWSSTKPTACN